MTEESGLRIGDRGTDSALRAGWTGRALMTVAVLGVSAGVQMSDRGLQATLLAPIEATFGVGDAAIGALQGLAGVLVGSALAIPIGRMADGGARKPLFVGLIAAWSLLMGLSALAPTFAIFFLGRAASGVTEFAMIPIVYSWIPDLASERHRVTANLAFAALMAAGSSAGFYWGADLTNIAAGLIPADIAPWRKGMLLLSAAGPPLLLLGLITVDPPRRAVVANSEQARSLLSFLASRWRSVGLFVGVAGSLLIAVQALNPLIALALQRRFGTPIGEIGRALGVATFVTSIGCLPLAGAPDRVLRRRFGLAARPIIMGVAASLALPCALLLPQAIEADQALLIVGLFLFLTCTANAMVPTMLQDLTPVVLRARSFAVWSFVVSIFCAIGPLLAGLLSERLLGGRLLAAIAVTAVPALAVSAFCAARSAAASLVLRPGFSAGAAAAAIDR